jgi:hypothetical protein
VDVAAFDIPTPPAESMPAPAPSLLPGQSPPFFVVTPTDQAGVIVNAAAICLVFALLSILIRAYVRFEINRQAWSWDDGVVVAALVRDVIRPPLVLRFADAGHTRLPTSSRLP